MSKTILRTSFDPQTAVSVDNLGKSYRVHQGNSRGAAFGYRTLRDDLAWWATARLRWFGPTKETSQDFWALRDVRFDIKPGEVMGIIGRNGAGKSTLLKILSRITKPSTGEVRLRGRVGSLLEVGTGFHPELTGRENILLNGSILGMRRTEIVRKFDQIVDFSEIGPFLDTPMKRYSSGMYMRLAFAVAAHLEPEILIIDEVLAVGDLAFQRKCLGRLREVGRSGSTIVFVSHNMPAVESLCTRALLLDHGRVVMAGAPRDLVQEYHRRLLETQGEGTTDLDSVESRSRPRKVFCTVSLLDEAGQPTNFLPVGGVFHLRVGLETTLSLDSPTITIGIDDSRGQRLLSLLTPKRQPVLEKLSGRGIVECRVASLPLAPGDYWIKLGLATVADEVDDVERVLRFTVTEGELFDSGRGVHRGLCVAPSQWTFQQE